MLYLHPNGVMPFNVRGGARLIAAEPAVIRPGERRRISVGVSAIVCPKTYGMLLPLQHMILEGIDMYPGIFQKLNQILFIIISKFNFNF